MFSRSLHKLVLERLAAGTIKERRNRWHAMYASVSTY